MRSAQLFLLENVPNPHSVTLDEFYNDGERSSGRSVEKAEYQNKPAGYVGWAAGTVTTGGEVPIVQLDQDDDVFIDRKIDPDAQSIHVATEYVADPAEEFVGIDRSVADAVARRIASEWETVAFEAELILSEWIEQDPVQEGTAWAETSSDPDGALIAYDDRASRQRAVNSGEALAGYGFEYRSPVAGHVRGQVFRSGYVTVYGDLTDQIWLQWLREEVVPFLEVADDEQAALTDTGGDEDDAE